MKTHPSLLAAALLLAAPATAQELPPAATPPIKPPAKTHHIRHHRRHVALTPAAPLPAAPQPAPAASAGTTPAPVPNEDIGPPRPPADTSASVDPGNLSIHYPPLGQGYLPGSSPQDMANTQTPKVPGVTVKVPLQEATPETLPPPDVPPAASSGAH